MTEQEKIDQYRETLSLKYTEIIEMRNELKQYLLKHKIDCANVNDLPTLQDYLQDVDTGNTEYTEIVLDSSSTYLIKSLATNDDGTKIVGIGKSTSDTTSNTYRHAILYDTVTKTSTLSSLSKTTNSVSFANGKFFIGEYYGGTEIAFLYSNDGINWTRKTIDTLTESNSIKVYETYYTHGNYYVSVNIMPSSDNCTNTLYKLDDSFNVISSCSMTRSRDSSRVCHYHAESDTLFIEDSYSIYKYNFDTETLEQHELFEGYIKDTCYVTHDIFSNYRYKNPDTGVGDIGTLGVLSDDLSAIQNIPSILPLPLYGTFFKIRSKVLYAPSNPTGLYVSSNGYMWDYINYDYVIRDVITAKTSPSKSDIYITSTKNEYAIFKLGSNFKTSKAAVLRLIGVPSSYTECTFEIHTNAIRSYYNSELHVNFITTTKLSSANNPTFTYTIAQNPSSNISTLTITTDVDFFYTGYPVIVDLIVGG